MSSIIRAENISKTFNGSVWVLDNINLEVQKGDFVSIIGASGSGKSTLLTILGGMDKPTKGKVFIDDDDITAYKESRLAKLRRTKIGFVFQFFNLASYLTVEENIMIPVVLNGKNIRTLQYKLEYLLRYLEIEDCRSKLPSKLSGGEQQRVAIARGLICDPDIIFLDEPTGNLDSKSAEQIMSLLKGINRDMGTTVLQVTHSEHNTTFGNRIIQISDGRIIER